MFQVWVCVGYHSFIFYQVTFIGSSRLIVEICLYFIFIKLICVHTTFLANDHVCITTYMSLEFARRLTDIFQIFISVSMGKIIFSVGLFLG